jgi:hypothetical protein
LPLENDPLTGVTGQYVIADSLMIVHSIQRLDAAEIGAGRRRRGSRWKYRAVWFPPCVSSLARVHGKERELAEYSATNVVNLDNAQAARALRDNLVRFRDLLPKVRQVLRRAAGRRGSVVRAGGRRL